VGEHCTVSPRTTVTFFIPFPHGYYLFLQRRKKPIFYFRIGSSTLLLYDSNQVKLRPREYGTDPRRINTFDTWSYLAIGRTAIRRTVVKVVGQAVAITNRNIDDARRHGSAVRSITEIGVIRNAIVWRSHCLCLFGNSTVSAQFDSLFYPCSSPFAKFPPISFQNTQIDLVVFERPQTSFRSRTSLDIPRNKLKQLNQ
jgi:hypothetical protein